MRSGEGINGVEWGSVVAPAQSRVAIPLLWAAVKGLGSGPSPVPTRNEKLTRMLNSGRRLVAQDHERLFDYGYLDGGVRLQEAQGPADRQDGGGAEVSLPPGIRAAAEVAGRGSNAELPEGPGEKQVGSDHEKAVG